MAACALAEGSRLPANVLCLSLHTSLNYRLLHITQKYGIIGVQKKKNNKLKERTDLK